MRTCIVSPHLDDAILSCGVLMQRLATGPDEVLSLGLFTAGARSELRKREDRLAMASIGASPFHLDELDAPDRDPAYRSMRQLFFGPLDPRDPYVDRVERRVRDFLAANSIDVAYFPLAAGTHIDHRIAHEIGRRIRDRTVRFYEDRPYVLWPGILHSRMVQLGADAGLPPVSEQTMRDAVDAYHHLEQFVPRGEHRDETLPLYLAALTGTARRSVTARPEALVATDEELRRLYQCLALYESQIGAIYGDGETFLADSLRWEHAMSGRSAYIERSWTLTPHAHSATRS